MTNLQLTAGLGTTLYNIVKCHRMIPQGFTLFILHYSHGVPRKPPKPCHSQSKASSFRNCNILKVLFNDFFIPFFATPGMSCAYELHTGMWFPKGLEPEQTLAVLMKSVSHTSR